MKIPSEENKARALKLYSAPFRFDEPTYKIQIFDANYNIIADYDYDEELRVRGWGRISYMEDPENLQDAVEWHIEQAVGNEKDKEKHLELLNAYWKENGD